MTNADIAFLATGVLAVVGGLLAITSRRVVHAALWLVVALLGVAGSLIVLGAELVGLILVVVYVGAVVVLVLFALMLTRAPIGPDQAHRVGVWRHLGSYAAGLATTALLLAVLAPLAGTAPVDRVEVGDHRGGEQVVVGQVVEGAHDDGLDRVGAMLPVEGVEGGEVERVEVDSSAMAADLFGTWVWPFEALSVLLLAALVGGLAVARGVRRS